MNYQQAIAALTETVNSVADDKPGGVVVSFEALQAVVHRDLIATTSHSTLKELAEAATPGPWISAHHGVFCEEQRIRSICRVSATVGKYEPEQANRDFIAAANPAVVLGMLGERAALLALLKEHVVAWENDSKEFDEMEWNGRAIEALEEAGIEF